MLNFDIFWKTNQGSEVFQIVYRKIINTTKLSVLFNSLENKLVSLSCSRTESFIIEKLIRECSLEVKLKIFEIVCREYSDRSNDPVFIFIGNSKANFVIQTIFKCTTENMNIGNGNIAMNMNYNFDDYKNVILNKISK